jgi:ATP-dependent protease HslVU (ClpYQ) peptidase subunit
MCGALAGHLGLVLAAADEHDSWAELRPALLRRRREGWSALVYDQTKGQLISTDNDGWVVNVRTRSAALGSGAKYALGYLDALPEVRTLDAAARQVKAAIRCAIRHDSACGGRIRLLIASRSAPVRVV